MTTANHDDFWDDIDPDHEPPKRPYRDGLVLLIGVLFAVAVAIIGWRVMQ